MLRSSEEQETLLGDDELADDDGCYPPRKNDDPHAENPHASLPIYTTIHRIRRLVIASIGMWRSHVASEMCTEDGQMIRMTAQCSCLLASTSLLSVLW